MYCAKCGVELQKGLKKCPLCGLRVYHPLIDEEQEDRKYPEYIPVEEKHNKGMAIVLTFLTLIPIIICLIVDLKLYGRITWSGYVLGGIISGYAFIILPMWFRKSNPVIFYPSGMAALLLYILYICLKTGGHWFWSFAFPIWLIVTLLIETEITLLYYAVRKESYRIAVILGSGIIAVGALCVFIELLIHLAFGYAFLRWSAIPFSIMLILGIMIIIIGSVKVLRESVYKKIFI